MPKISLSVAPDLGDDAKYGEYKPWLLENFYRDLCSYCLEQYGALTVDHYVPQSYDDSRTHDPTNLLLGCPNCQRKKWDYHPAHASRRRLPRDTTGFMVVDVREDDLAAMFSLRDDGTLRVRTGTLAARAIWNVKLLRLDLYDEKRARVLHKLSVAEGLLEGLDQAEGSAQSQLESALNVLVEDLAERQPFLTAFGIPVSGQLRARLQAAIPAVSAE
jgi:hypothetical protein